MKKILRRFGQSGCREGEPKPRLACPCKATMGRRSFRAKTPDEPSFSHTSFFFPILGFFVALAIADLFAQESSAPAPAQATASFPLPQVQPAAVKPLRDPFWPPDYWPKDTNQVQVVVKVDPTSTNEQTDAQIPVKENVVRWPELKVKGLIRLMNGNYGAMIEGVPGMIEAGQRIAIKRDGITFRWKIKEINEKGITREKLDYKPAGR